MKSPYRLQYNQQCNRIKQKSGFKVILDQVLSVWKVFGDAGSKYMHDGDRGTEPETPPCLWIPLQIFSQPNTEPCSCVGSSICD